MDYYSDFFPFLDKKMRFSYTQSSFSHIFFMQGGIRMWQPFVLFILLYGSTAYAAWDCLLHSHQLPIKASVEEWIDHVEEAHPDFLLQYQHFFDMEKRTIVRKSRKFLLREFHDAVTASIKTRSSRADIRSASADADATSVQKRKRSKKSSAPTPVELTEEPVAKRAPPISPDFIVKIDPYDPSKTYISSVLPREVQATSDQTLQVAKPFLQVFLHARTAKESLELIKIFVQTQTGSKTSIWSKEEIADFRAFFFEEKLAWNERKSHFLLGKNGEKKGWHKVELGKGEKMTLDDQIYWLRKIPMFEDISAQAFHDFIIGEGDITSLTPTEMPELLPL